MTITAVMQPYLFPYLGYWQLARAVDVFVLLDDVNFIKKGWINRNNILIDGRAHLFTLPLVGASQNRLINEIQISSDFRERQKLLKTIIQAYAKAPHFDEVYSMVEMVLNYPENDLTRFLHHQFLIMFEYLGLPTKLLRSSEMEKDNGLRAQERIIDICRRLGTRAYINAAGGRELYEKDRFQAENMELKFIKMRPAVYPQFKRDFVPGLSIIDVLMFNGRDRARRLLDDYDLI